MVLFSKDISMTKVVDMVVVCKSNFVDTVVKLMLTSAHISKTSLKAKSSVFMKPTNLL